MRERIKKASCKRVTGYGQQKVGRCFLAMTEGVWRWENRRGAGSQYWAACKPQRENKQDG